MAQYIDKSALVAEIKRIEHETNYEAFTDEVLGKIYVCKSLLSFLNTLEVKEVDLEKEIKKYIEDNICGYCAPGVEETAKHFFELGIAVNNKAQKNDKRISVVTVKEAIERKIINSPFALKGGYSGKIYFYSWKKSISKMPENIANLKLSTNYDFDKGELGSYHIEPMVRVVESSFAGKSYLQPYVVVWVNDYELSKK